MDIIDLNHLINRVSMAPIGQAVEVVVWRDRHEVTLHVTVADRERTFTKSSGTSPGPGLDPSGLVRRPNRPGETSNFVMGLELSTLTPELARRSDLPESWHGALIQNVDPESPLVDLVRPHDVISAIDNQAIQSADQVVTILNQRADHVHSIISLDRLAKGVVERHTIRLP
jgi:serine protease Do